MAIKIKKEELKTGDILLVSSHSWLAKKIQWFTKNPWNHAMVYIELWGEHYVCEAERHGICLTNLNDYINSDKKLMVCRPTYTYDKKELSNLMLKHCGWSKYNYASLLFFQVVKQTTGKWIGRKGDAAEKKYTCSEWSAYVHNQVNPKVFPDWYKLAPADIYYDVNFLHLDFEK